MKTLKVILFHVKGRTRVRVTMSVKHKEKRQYGNIVRYYCDYWYQAKSKTECIMEEPTEAVLKFIIL